MRNRRIWPAVVLVLACFAYAQQPATKVKQVRLSSNASAQSDLEKILEAKVKAEWDAFKKKDKKAYGDLLADDFVAVEDDGDGERNKIHAVNEVDASNIYNYTLAVFKFVPLAPDVAFVRYEVTMEFPPKSVNRFKRVIISEIWRRSNGQWKAWHYQETRVK